MFDDRKNRILLLFHSLICTFAPVKLDNRRHIASWLLLAVFVPMLILSSLHEHDTSVSAAETECVDCVHHSCHGHLTQMASWTHDCVLCQFLTLPMLVAVMLAVTVSALVCNKRYAQPLYGYRADSCGVIVTRGPPFV